MGLALAAAAIAIAGSAVLQFRRAGTTVRVDRATTRLVDGGVFRHTRNPMYVALALLLLAFATGFNSFWLLLAVPAFVAAVRKLAIEREEAYLERRFGEAYRAYRRRVPRWFRIGARGDAAS